MRFPGALAALACRPATGAIAGQMPAETAAAGQIGLVTDPIPALVHRTR
jgi:hypothetical protein